MRIGCLQFAPLVGEWEKNIRRANDILAKAHPEDLDLLVLPEMALSGYNFKSLEHITPYLEPTASGISSIWAQQTARKYKCYVTVGYPEKEKTENSVDSTLAKCYNSAVTFNAEGELVANYRKSFLFYTDDTWASEGQGFFIGKVPKLGKVAMGICMDLNPYKFEAPWSACEFAHHVLNEQASLAILSMAWSTREAATSFRQSLDAPDMDSISYWLSRVAPIVDAAGSGEVVIVFANRTGVEDEAVYVGTSAVIGIQAGEVKLYGLFSRGEEELLVVDTSKGFYKKFLVGSA